MNDSPEFPHAPMAEKWVLSAMFRNPGNIARGAAEGIVADTFHIPAHRNILERLTLARNAGHLTEDGEIDLGLFVQSASIDGALAGMGGPAEIYDIAGYAVSLAGWSGWCDQLRETKARRIAVEAAHTLSGVLDSGEAIQAATDALDAMRMAITAKTRSLNAKQACEDFLAKYIAAYQNGEIPGQSTGIGEIDAITGGMRPGELWIVSGPSSSGKSVLMYQFASEFLGENRVVAMFSAELMNHEIVGRLTTLRARVGYDAITKPQEVTKREMERVRTAVMEMAATRMWIDPSGGQSIETISGEAERIRDIEGGIDLIVVDYIQIIKGIRGRGDSREQEVASISGGLKQLAKKMGCPVITGSQENDDGKTRESRAIENDADVWIKITESGILMKKVRNGARDQTLNLALDGSAQRFRHFHQHQTE